jgi:ACS family sodium-dependent inorganic phosphate cotransporter
LSNTAGTLPGIFGVYITGWLIDRTGSFTAPFFLTAAVGIAGAIVYLLYASGVREIE